jgi:hypothetical protein
MDVHAAARSTDALHPEGRRVADVGQPRVVLGQSEVLGPQRRPQGAHGDANVGNVIRDRSNRALLADLDGRLPVAWAAAGASP